MNNFIYETPTKVYFGKDEEHKVGKIVAEYHPQKVLIHYGGKSAKDIANDAGLAAIWCSWARYVYRANMNRWLQYAHNVWNLDIDFEHPEKTIELVIDKQEQ